MELAEFTKVHPVIDALRAVWSPSGQVEQVETRPGDLGVLARVRWALQEFVGQDNSIIGLTETREYLEDYGKLPLPLSFKLRKIARELKSPAWRALVWQLATGDVRRAR
jgi:hypothetical protein